MELKRANRTKFFDLIIPVVAFTSHTNARDIFASELTSSEYAELSTVIRRLASHVAEPRIIRNICNEYRVYSQALSAKDGSLQLGLEHEKLFALMIYKSMYLNDYEKIRFGDSLIDEFYSEFLKEKEKLLETKRKKLLTIKQSSHFFNLTETTVSQMGDKLISHLLDLEYRIEEHDASASVDYVYLNDDKFNKEQLMTADFWQQLHQNGIITFSVEYSSSSNRYKIPRSNLETLFNISFDPERSLQERLKDFEAEKNDLEKQINDITFLDLDQLMTIGSFLLSTLSEVKEVLTTQAGELFGSSLLRNIVGYGYIDRFYPLYASVFQGKHLTANATAFLLHHLQGGKEAISYRLTDDEIQKLILETDSGDWSTPGACNLDVLHCLISKRANYQWSDKESDIFEQIRGVMEMNPKLLRSSSRGILGGNNLDFKRGYVEWCSEFNPDIFSDIIRFSSPSEETTDLLNAAFSTISAEQEYPLGANEIEWLQGNLEKIKFFTEKSAEEKWIKKGFSCLVDWNITIGSLSLFCSEIQDLALQTCNFELNAANFKLFVERHGSAAFDVLVDANTNFIGLLEEYIGSYIELFSVSDSIALEDPSPRHFTLLEEVWNENSANVLEGLLNHSTKADWNLSSPLVKIPVEFLPLLAEYGRIAKDLQTLMEYFDLCDRDRERALVLLPGGEIENSNLVDEKERIEFAYSVINISDGRLSTDQRLELIESLDLDEYLTLDKINDLSGEYIVALLSKQLIPEDTELFSFIRDIPVQEQLLVVQNSEEFLSVLTPGLCSEELLCALFTSSGTETVVKDALALNPRQYLGDNVGKELVDILLKYGLSGVKELRDFESLMWAAELGGQPLLIVERLADGRDSYTIHQVEEILQMLGGKFAEIAAPTGKHPAFENTPAMRSLLDFLLEHGSVSTVKEQGSRLRVYMKKS